MISIFALAAAVFTSFFKGQRSLVLENLALRQQLVVYKRAQERPPLRSTDRAFWVWLSKVWSGWRTPLLLVRPETVIKWHRQSCRLYWRWKSRTKKIGRPTIPREHIAFILRMSRENPSWGEGKINEELRVKFGIRPSTSTIRKYMTKRQPRRDGQKWRTFIQNHSREICACDFMTQYTALFAIVYVFIVMEIQTRRIVHCNVTESPTLDWVKMQIRDIVAFDCKPRFLLHHNDGIFGRFGRRKGASAATLIAGYQRRWTLRDCPRRTAHRTRMRMSIGSIVRYAKTGSITSSFSMPPTLDGSSGNSSNTTTARARRRRHMRSPIPILSWSTSHTPLAS